MDDMMMPIADHTVRSTKTQNRLPIRSLHRVLAPITNRTTGVNGANGRIPFPLPIQPTELKWRTKVRPWHEVVYYMDLAPGVTPWHLRLCLALALLLALTLKALWRFSHCTLTHNDASDARWRHGHWP